MAEPANPTTWKAVVATIVVGVVGAVLNYRIDSERLRAEAGYGVVAPAVKELQTRIAALDDQMQVLQRLVLAQSVKPAPVAPAATLDANVAVEKFKKSLVVKVQASQSHPAPPQRHLPDRLEDVPAMK